MITVFQRCHAYFFVKYEVKPLLRERLWCVSTSVRCKGNKLLWNSSSGIFLLSKPVSSDFHEALRRLRCPTQLIKNLFDAKIFSLLVFPNQISFTIFLPSRIKEDPIKWLNHSISNCAVQYQDQAKTRSSSFYLIENPKSDVNFIR